MTRPNAPLAQRMARSDQWRERYRSDPAFRRSHINKTRRSQGLDPLPDDQPLPPVGKMRPKWADQRERDTLGRFL